MLLLLLLMLLTPRILLRPLMLLLGDLRDVRAPRQSSTTATSWTL